MGKLSLSKDLHDVVNVPNLFGGNLDFLKIKRLLKAHDGTRAVLTRCWNTK